MKYPVVSKFDCFARVKASAASGKYWAEGSVSATRPRMLHAASITVSDKTDAGKIVFRFGFDWWAADRDDVKKGVVTTTSTVGTHPGGDESVVISTPVSLMPRDSIDCSTLVAKGAVFWEKKNTLFFFF